MAYQIVKYVNPFEFQALNFVRAAHVFNTLVKYKGNVRRSAKHLKVKYGKIRIAMERYGIGRIAKGGEVTWPREKQLVLANEIYVGGRWPEQEIE